VDARQAGGPRRSKAPVGQQREETDKRRKTKKAGDWGGGRGRPGRGNGDERREDRAREEKGQKEGARRAAELATTFQGAPASKKAGAEEPGGGAGEPAGRTNDTTDPHVRAAGNTGRRLGGKDQSAAPREGPSGVAQTRTQRGAGWCRGPPAAKK